VVFAAVCLAMAGYHQWVHPLDSKFIGLVLLASAGWLVPWMAKFVAKVKVGDFELDIKDEIAKTQQVAEAAAAAAMTGSAKPPVRRRRLKLPLAGIGPGDVTHVLEAPPSDKPAEHGPPGGADGDPDTSVDADSDPNKGKFGGKPNRDGLRLNAQVRSMAQSSEYFLIHAWVGADAGQSPLSDGTEVTFYLHPTFPERMVKARAVNGVAAIDRLAWGAFTIGAEVGSSRLELDLATDLPDAPAAFRER